MAYSRTWDATLPLGSAAADTLETIIQNFKEDVEERMDDVCVDWSADPVEVDFATVGAQTDVHVFFGHEILQPIADEDDVTYSEAYLQSDNDTGAIMQGHIALPVGAELTQFEVLWDKQSAAGMDCYLKHRTWTAGTLIQVGFVNSTDGGIHASDVYGPAGSHNILDNKMYYVKLVPTDNNRIRIYGFRATISVAGLVGYIG